VFSQWIPLVQCNVACLVVNTLAMLFSLLIQFTLVFPLTINGNYVNPLMDISDTVTTRTLKSVMLCDVT
jgi:hypothetical protein